MAYSFDDIWIDLGVDERVPFEVTEGSNVVYSGIAHKRPGQPTNRINFKGVLPQPQPWGDIYRPAAAAYDYTIEDDKAIKYYKVTDLGASKGAFGLYYNWSYREVLEFFSTQYIKPEVSDRQLLVVNVLCDVVQYFNLTVGGNTITLLDGSETAEFYTVRVDLTKIPEAQVADSLSLELLTYEGDTAYLDLNITHCGHDYALHYVDELGGWASLLCNGTPSVKYKRYDYQRERIYTAGKAWMAQRERNIYAEDATLSYELTTDFLLGSQGERIGEVIGSPVVTLEDLKTGALLPVTIDTSSVELKNYRRNGAKLVNYKIKVTSAQTFQR